MLHLWILPTMALMFGSGVSLTLSSFQKSFISLEMIFHSQFFTMIFSSSVCIILFSICLFSKYYIGDRFYSSFVMMVLVFAASMICFIFSDSFFLFLLGWDGLGVSSYFLILWFQSWSSGDNSMVTFLTNRGGDMLILLSLIMSITGTYLSNSFLPASIIGMFLVGAITKSAQTPFTTWLPLAMSAPTPVSALVHSSTLVTAGVFVLFKISISNQNNYLMFVSIATLWVAGSLSVAESDAKKIVALSTLSQVGFMVFSLSLGTWGLAFWHLITHAFTKSLMFIFIGSLLHANFSEQDKRSQFSVPPWTALGMMICSLSLCGMAFMTSFSSKDFILLTTMESSNQLFLTISLLMGLCFTFWYCARLMSTIWVSMGTHWSVSVLFWKSTLPLILLTIFSGWCLNLWFPMAPSSSGLSEKLAPLLLPLVSLLVLISMSLHYFISSYSTNMFNLSSARKLSVSPSMKTWEGKSSLFFLSTLSKSLESLKSLKSLLFMFSLFIMWMLFLI